MLVADAKHLDDASPDDPDHHDCEAGRKRHKEGDNQHRRTFVLVETSSESSGEPR
jgi:hypothetical protein